MDRNTVTGLILIALILISSTFLFKSTPEEEKNTKVAGKDSVMKSPAVINADSASSVSDSLVASNLPAGWSGFAKGENKTVTIENDDVKVNVSAKGGRITYVELKKYKTSDGKPLVMQNEHSSNFGFAFSAGNTTVNTADLYFVPANITQKSVTMRVQTADGKAIEQIYSVGNEGYMVNYDLRLAGLNTVIPKKDTYLDLTWQASIFKQERDSQIASHNSTIYYRNSEETPEHLSETEDDEEKFKAKTDWVSFKQQFFCQTLISKQPFINADISTQVAGNTNYLKDFKAQLTLPFDHKPEQQYDMQFYFGPLHYKTLKSYDMALEKQVPLGWGIFGWVNKFIVIPVFNFLSQFIGNYGIIILLLTIFIKLIVMPLTYKSYLSTAKMRILKPELDEIKEKYGDDMARQQQEQMRLYRKAGVSPFGGCLPLLLQFPILIAMFRFFPASIELRQEKFLWAHDLSTYDNILPFFGIDRLPFHIPAYGDHVSLFTILMTVSTLIYTKLNNSISNQPKEFMWMSYLMLIFFLGFFNNYAAGLSLYYFYFNVLTFLQQYLFKLFIDDKKLHAKIEENKRRPESAKKGGLQKKLEDIQKRQQEMQKKKSQQPPRRK